MERKLMNDVKIAISMMVFEIQNTDVTNTDQDQFVFAVWSWSQKLSRKSYVETNFSEK